MGNSLQSRIIIIKLGGSVVTFKGSQFPKARISTIRRLASEIQQIDKKRYQLILVHGAGSFGHPLAKKYNLIQGLKDQNSCIGFAETAQAMVKLNQIIMLALHKCGLPAINLPPHTFITQTNNRLDEFDTSLIKNLLKKGFIPVLYGDPVIDKKLGCSILSGDVIIPYLAKKLKAEKVIFLTDVDGIFDDDPKKNSRAKLIREVNNDNLDQVLYNIKIGDRDDVTGEMAGKILAIQKNLKGKKVIITNGLKPKSLLKAMDQNPAGTMLHLE